MDEEDVMVLSGAWDRALSVLSLMHLQILVAKYLTSLYILDPRKRSLMSF